MLKKSIVSSLLGLLLLGCIAPPPDGGSSGGGTSGVGLYVFDTSSKQVAVWKDLSALYDDAATPAATYTLTSGEFSNIGTLAWSGMAFNPSGNQLYLVSETGSIVRVNRARAQTGAISNTDILTFSLDNSAPLTNFKFGQASVDASSGTLYVTENGDNGTRIWAVTNAGSRVAGEKVPLSAVQVTGGGSGDSGGYGVAAAQGSVYGSFNGGDTVVSGSTSYTGARLRKGTSSGFLPDTQVVVGPNSLLGEFGPLGLDTGNNILYTGVHLSTAGVTGGSPVLAFKISQLGLGISPNQSPNMVFGDASTDKTLRFMTHGGSKDWLVAGPEAGTELWIWKQPSAGDTQRKNKTLPSSLVARATALDSNG
jgi:hypothetical protein